MSSQNNANNQGPIRIFLSYTRVDHAQAQQFYKRLQAEGFEPWMDTEDLLPGQKFEYHIHEQRQKVEMLNRCYEQIQRFKVRRASHGK